MLQHQNPGKCSHGLHPASAEIRCAFFVYCCLHVLLFVLHVNAHARVRLFIDRSLWSIRSLIFVFLCSAECSTGVVGAACIHRPSALLRCPQRHWRSQARVFPRRKAGEDKCSTDRQCCYADKGATDNPVVLTKEMLLPLFAIPLWDAADIMVSVECVLSICRSFLSLITVP